MGRGESLEIRVAFSFQSVRNGSSPSTRQCLVEALEYPVRLAIPPGPRHDPLFSDEASVSTEENPRDPDVIQMTDTALRELAGFPCVRQLVVVHGQSMRVHWPA